MREGYYSGSGFLSRYGVFIYSANNELHLNACDKVEFPTASFIVALRTIRDIVASPQSVVLKVLQMNLSFHAEHISGPVEPDLDLFKKRGVIVPLSIATASGAQLSLLIANTFSVLTNSSRVSCSSH